VQRILISRPDKPVETAEPAALPALLAEPDVFVWVDLSGPPDEGDVALVRDIFGFHPLAIEDCFQERTHPKIDEYRDHLYLITHGLTAESGAESAAVVELDAFVSERYLVTHHNVPSRSVSAVIDAVTRTGLPLRRGPLATLHAVLDRQADNLEEVLDRIAERIEVIEHDIFVRPVNRQLASLLAVKRNILHLRRWMGRQREVVLRLGRREFPVVAEAEARLFRDLHDHLARYTDTLDSFREMLTSIQETYLSVVSNRLNEVMKFLAMFTTMLMPLTVITGVYGMNFDHMPELRWRWGYPFVLVLMALVAGGALLYFRRRGWLGGDRPHRRHRHSPGSGGRRRHRRERTGGSPAVEAASGSVEPPK
jgi:magnesium transporter